MKKHFYLLFFISLNISAQNGTASLSNNNQSTGKYAHVNGINMYYEVYGTGEPLLLLHGGTGSIEDLKDVIPYLSKKFQVIAVDFRGHGRTNNALDSMSYALHTTDILEFINFLKLEKLRIIGYSDGGVVALKLAVEIPEKINRMIVAGANKSIDDLTDNIMEYAKLMASDNNMSNAHIKERKTAYAQSNPEPEKYKRFMQLVGQMWLREPYITDNDYAKIKTPTLFMYGDRDLIKFNRMIQMYTDFKSEKKQLCILPNTNHFVFKAEYMNMVAPIILQYLDTNN